MTGMGVVRTGPPVQGQRHSPRKSTSSNALARDAVVALHDAPSSALGRPSFGAEAHREREVKPLPRSASATRVGAAPRVASGTEAALRTLAEEPTIQESFDEMMASSSVGGLVSPAKRGVVGSVAMVRSPAARPPGIFGGGPSPSIVVDSALHSTPMAGSSSQRLAVPRSSPTRGALSPRSLTGRTPLTRKLDEVESDSEEDDIDFLSPRKKTAKRIHLSASSPVAPGPASPARPLSRPLEPQQLEDDDVTIHAPVLPHSPSRRYVEPQQRPTFPEAASVPMARGGRTFALPSLTAPDLSAMPTPRSMIGASSSTAGSAMLPPLVMPRARAPALAIDQDDRSPSSSTSLSGFRPLRLTSSATPAAAATSASMGVGTSGSRLPRPQRVSLAAPVPIDPRPHPIVDLPAAPPPAVSEDVSMVVEDGPCAADGDADVSMCSAADASTVSSTSTASSTSSTYSTSSRSEETARRLANLQSMLSRLQMPKPSAPSSRRTSAPTSTGTLSSRPTIPTSTSSSRDYEVPLAPAHEPLAGRRTALPRSRTSLPSIVGPPPPAPATHVAPLLPSGPTARRRSTVVARPPGGIVNTATRPASSSLVGATSTSSSTTSSSSTPVSSASRPSARRISSTTLPSSASVGMSLSVDSTGAAALSESVGRPRGNRAALQGVVACVDVRTAEGDDSGMVFVDLLKSMGARVRPRFSLSPALSSLRTS